MGMQEWPRVIGKLAVLMQQLKSLLQSTLMMLCIQHCLQMSVELYLTIDVICGIILCTEGPIKQRPLYHYF